MKNNRLHLFKFLITIDNDKMTDKDLISYLLNLKDFEKCVFQREKSKNEIIEHIHLFIVFKTLKTLETIKKYFPNTDIKAVIGDERKIINYCTKSKNRVSGPYILNSLI